MKPHCTALAIRPDCPRAREIPRQLVAPNVFLHPTLILFAKRKGSQGVTRIFTTASPEEREAAKRRFYADHKDPHWEYVGDFTVSDLCLNLAKVQFLQNPYTGYSLPGECLFGQTHATLLRRWLNNLFTA